MKDKRVPKSILIARPEGKRDLKNKNERAGWRG
jgi:hypothetical protein